MDPIGHGISWLDFVQRLKQIVSESARDLFLIASTPKEEGIAEGLQLAGPPRSTPP
jgi:hypothetical protein